MAKKKGTTKASASTIPASLVESTSTIKTISTTTSGFADQAYENGILDPIYSKPPANLQELRTRYAQARGTASPTESAFEDYVYQVGLAENESTMVFETGRVLLKHYEGTGYKTTLNQAFTGFPKDVGFNDGLSAPQPDFVQGVTKHEYGDFAVSKHIVGSVLSKDTPSSVTLPHIAGEWKGPGKDLAAARLQSAYDGAALVYARNQALSYLGKPDPQGHAEVTTFTTDGTTLNMFAHYAAPSEDGTLKYHQYPIKSTNLTDSHQGLKDGRRGLRNIQDHAREHSFAMRDQLKEHWKQQRVGSRPVTNEDLSAGADGALEETSIGENGYVVVEPPCQLTPAASSSLSSSKSAQPLDDHSSLDDHPPLKSQAPLDDHPHLDNQPPLDDYPPLDRASSGSGHKRKASSPQQGPSRASSKMRSKAQDYWKWDAKERK